MLIPSEHFKHGVLRSSLSRRVNANSQRIWRNMSRASKLIKKGEC